MTYAMDLAPGEAVAPALRSVSSSVTSVNDAMNWMTLPLPSGELNELKRT